MNVLLTNQEVAVKTLICPYCGCSLVRLGVTREKAATYSYDGTEYHFCCQDCVDEFAGDPERHLECSESEPPADDLDHGRYETHLRIPGHRERRFQPKVNIHSKAS